MLSSCSIRDITAEIAVAVIREALAEDLAEGYRGMDPRELQKLNQVPPVYILFSLFLSSVVIFIN